MRLRPLAELSASEAKKLKLVVCDFDGTITTKNGKLSERSLAALFLFKSAGLKVVVATGRSAAAGQSLAMFLPHIEGVICENGAVYFSADNPRRMQMFRSGLRSSSFRRELEAAFSHVRTVYPSLKRAEDDIFRVAEIAILRSNSLSESDIKSITNIVKERGLGFTYSSVHMHITAPDVNKWEMIKKLTADLSITDPFDEIITVGDSFNDANLFAPQNVAISVGLAQIKNYINKLGNNLPKFICSKEADEGLFELAATLDLLRSNKQN